METIEVKQGQTLIEEGAHNDLANEMGWDSWEEMIRELGLSEGQASEIYWPVGEPRDIPFGSAISMPGTVLNLVMGRAFLEELDIYDGEDAVLCVDFALLG